MSPFVAAAPAEEWAAIALASLECALSSGDHSAEVLAWFEAHGVRW